MTYDRFCFTEELLLLYLRTRKKITLIRIIINIQNIEGAGTGGQGKGVVTQLNNNVVVDTKTEFVVILSSCFWSGTQMSVGP